MTNSTKMREVTRAPGAGSAPIGFLFRLLAWLAASLVLAPALPAELALTNEQRAWLDEHPVIRLAPDPDFAPIEFFEGDRYAGIAADYVNLIEDALGIEFEIVHLPSWAEVVAAAKSREVDMYGAAMESPERLEYMLFTEPHIQTAAVIVVREDTPGRLTLEQMAGQRVAVVEGYVVEEHVRTNHPQVTAVPVSSTLDALRAVSYGEVDAMVGDEATASQVILESGITNLRVAGEAGLRVNLAIASRSDWPELNQLLDEALASITPDERRAIRQRWIHLSASVPQQGPADEVNLTEEEKRWLGDHPEIRLGPYADYPPAEFVDENGVHRGIAADYVGLIQERLGITFTLVPTDTWQELIDATKTRDIDVLALVAQTTEREEYLAFTEPYLRLPAVIIAQTGTENLDPSDLDGERVAVVGGYAVQEYLENTHPNMILVPVADNVTGLRMVSTGGVKAFISDLAPATYHIEREGITNLTVVGESGFVYVMGLACRSDWPELRSILDKALASITPEERRAISNRWLSLQGVEGPIDRGLLLIAGLSALAAVVILVVLALWIRRMRREIQTLSESGGLSLGGESFRRNRRRILGVSVATLALTALLLGLMTNWVLYRAALRQREQSLVEMADSQARLIEAVARFDAIHSQEDHPEGAAAATLQQVVDAHNRFSGIGRTGEFTFGTVRNDTIVYLLMPRHTTESDFTGVPLMAEGGRGEAMRRALRGERGTMVGLDYRGKEVLAAYQPIESTQAAIVAKVDLAEVRAPFIRAGVLTGGVGIGLIFIGGMLIAWTTTPLLRRIEESEAQFRTLVGNIPGVTYRCLLDEHWTMLFISDGVEELTGHPATEFLHNEVRTFDSVIHPDDRATVTEQIEKAVAAGAPWTTEYRVFGPMGETRWVREKGRADVGPKGEVHWLDGAIFDITDRKAAEEELRKLTRAVEQSSSAIVITDTEGTIVYVNPQFTELTGYTAEEALGQNPRVLKSGQQPPEFYRDLWETIGRGEVWRGEFCNRKKNGEEFYEAASIAPVRNEAGEITHFVATKEDITERKQLEETIYRSRRLLRGVMDSTDALIFIKDLDGRYLMVNRRWSEVTGQSYQETIGKTDHELFPTEAADGFVAHDEEVRQTKTLRISEETLVADGEERVFQSSKFPLLDEEGEVFATGGNATDISERRRMEEEVRRVNFLSDIALKLTGCGYWHVDYSDPDHYYQSDRAAEILGEEIKEDQRYHLHDEWFARLIEADPEVAKMTEERYTGAIEGRYENYEATYAYKRPADGEIVWVHALGDCVRNKKGEITFMYGVYQDVTAVKESEAQLMEAREAAVAASAAKSEFLANMSHEIRTPMNAILGFSDLLRQSSLTDKEKAHLDAIRSSGKALLALINDILDLSKVEAGKLEIQYEAFSLPRLLAEVQTLFSQKAQQRGIGITLDIDPEMPQWVFLDEVRLRQILFNNVGNAMKFTHEGGVTVRARGTVDPHQTDHMHLVLEVQDTGIGIPPDQQARIFESFSQVSGQSTRKYGGTGLGLAISKRLTEMMGGSVSLESESGVGSIFRFEFPEVTLTAPQEVDDKTVLHRLDDLEPAKILCADDEPLNRALIEGYFEGMGHTLLLVENGKEAVEAAERELPDLILMDIRMPVMNGIEATTLIKSKHDIPVLALTASSMTGERNQVVEVCDMHLSKPISSSELARAMKEFLPTKPDRVPTAAEPASATAGSSEGGAPPEEAAFDTSSWPELLTLLRAEMDGDWKSLCETPNMDELEAFGNRLTGWAEEHAAPPLAQYARRLLQRIEEFDIENLPSTVRGFAEVVEGISAEADKR